MKKSSGQEFGKLIGKYRKLRGLSFATLGKLSGVHHTYIFLIEKGERTSPSWEKLDKIFDALNVPDNELLEVLGIECDEKHLEE